MGKRLFVGGLPFATTDDELKEAFEAYGTVIDARVITDHETGRSRGFGFVEFDTEDQAAAAIEAMNESELGGRQIKVSIAQERQ